MSDHDGVEQVITMAWRAQSGPAREAVRVECTLDLFAIGKGSATMSFAQPESNQTLQQELNDILQEPIDIQRLSEAAVRQVVQSIQEIKKGDVGSVTPGVVRSLPEMGALFSNGVTSIEWIMPRAAGRKRTSAVFDRKVYDRIVPQLKETEHRKPIQLAWSRSTSRIQMRGGRCVSSVR